MPSDASAMPAPELEPRLELVEGGGEELEPMLPIPEGVTVHADVDQDAADPALAPGRSRQCIAATRAGARCQAGAPRDHVLCNAHAGRLDSSAGGHARAAKLAAEREEAQNRAIEGRLGARGVIAAALREKGPELRLAIHSLADRAAAGDRQAALALIPFMTQGLGAPSSVPTEVQVDGEAVDLSSLDTASLRALLGR